jgi:hypothetical protein
VDLDLGEHGGARHHLSIAADRAGGDGCRRKAAGVGGHVYSSRAVEAALAEAKGLAEILRARASTMMGARPNRTKFE